MTFSILLWITLGILSLILAWQDFTSRYISLPLSLAMGGILMVLSFLTTSPLSFWWVEKIGGGLLPATVLLAGALRKKAGWGDVLVAFFYGWYVGIFHLGWWLLFSLVPAWIQVGIKVLEKETNPRIPFVTWMSVGFWLWLGSFSLELLPFSGTF
ncbi:hypothetical protein BREVNS_1291 [Brevinematales bacterium NS]|nr:hypothetical protein BREVNS_1291 [Brevinematales bacterium NS]